MNKETNGKIKREKKTKLEEEKDLLQALEENYDHFKEILDNGYEYLLLDGQHRLDRVNAYFNNEIDFS